MSAGKPARRTGVPPGGCRRKAAAVVLSRCPMRVEFQRGWSRSREHAAIRRQNLTRPCEHSVSADARPGETSDLKRGCLQHRCETARKTPTRPESGVFHARRQWGRRKREGGLAMTVTETLPGWPVDNSGQKLDRRNHPPALSGGSPPAS